MVLWALDEDITVGTSATDVTAVVVSAVYFVFANRVKKESQERLS